MKFNVLTLSVMMMSISLSQSMTCEEATSLLGLEYDGSCCDLPQIHCDENQKTILSM